MSITFTSVLLSYTHFSYDHCINSVVPDDNGKAPDVSTETPASDLGHKNVGNVPLHEEPEMDRTTGTRQRITSVMSRYGLN